MPRKGRVTGAGYGENKRLNEASQAMDAAMQGAGPPVAGQQSSAPVMPPAPAPPAQQGGVPPELLAAAAAGPSPQPGGLHGPSTDPNEPLTAGLPIGPGPGPEALAIGGRRRSNQLAETYEMLAQASGDPFYSQLARRARR